MSDAYVLQFTPPWNSCVADFQKQDPTGLLKMVQATTELAAQPFGNPRLQSHRMQGVKGKRYISYAGGSKGFRVIWDLVGKTIVLLLFGEHDDVERRGERMELVEDATTGGVTLVEHTVVEAAARAEPAPAPRSEPGQLFMAWNDQELADWFEPHEAEILRGLDTEADFLALEDRMAADTFERALNLILYANPAGEAATSVEPEERAARQQQVAEQQPEETKQLEQKISAPSSRKHFAPTTIDQLSEILDKPIEDWMVFLHPDQAKLTQRPFSGPARVRGGAGTGKTVVALHRARHLAETYRDGRILFTTFVNNLPPVFEQLFLRLAPEVADRVEFNNLHSWAHRFLTTHGRRPVIDPQAVSSAFAEAWRRHGGAPAIDQTGLSRDYIREEIDWIIKGRGLATLDDYLALSRSGRGTPLPAPARQAVWELYEAYEEGLRRQRVSDFSDLLTSALRLLESDQAETPYTAVLVDEAQDLTEVGLRLCFELAGRDRRDGLFLVGDGQQSVYPGGFSLGGVGIEVRGRSALLQHNYRNTTGILAAAARVVASHEFDDGDDTLTSGRRLIAVSRRGDEPEVQVFAGQDDHDLALAAAIETVAEDGRVGTGDVAVLVPTNRLVSHYESVIQGLGLPTQKLQKYAGVPNDFVKVGTYQRGKGLEFKHVFLPRLDPEGLAEPARPGEDDATHAERLDLIRRQLFVAMTRARDGLWLGCVGASSALLGIEEEAPA